MEIVFLDKETLNIMPFAVKKTMTEKNWQQLLQTATSKLGADLAVIF